jgi:CubicO group peptidase (beta-lactamase class C family)
LHKIIENITGKSFEETLEENMKSLKMQNTSMLKSATIVPGLVSSYTKSEQTNQFENDAPYLVEKNLAQVQCIQLLRIY